MDFEVLGFDYPYRLGLPYCVCMHDGLQVFAAGCPSTAKVLPKGIVIDW